MKPTISIAVFLALSSLGLAESWTGVLVDAKCYDSAERNTNPFEPFRDENLDVRLCRPNAHTKSFAIVQQDWRRLKLDPAGNAKAAELVRNADKKSHYLGVEVTGETSKDTIKVESILNR